MTTAELTPKAQQTRQHILDTALALFESQGYEATTMREIATAADCSLGLTYRYFARKEELVLAVYWRMAAETSRQIEGMRDETIAERFFQLMVIRLEQAARYREAFRALFGVAMNPGSGINILGENAAGMRDRVWQDFAKLVTEASDRPHESLIADVATMLYSLHFAVILFWLYDRHPEQHTTRDLLLFLRDTLKMLRQMLPVPMVRKSIVRMASIFERIFFSQ